MVVSILKPHAFAFHGIVWWLEKHHVGEKGDIEGVRAKLHWSCRSSTTEKRVRNSHSIQSTKDQCDPFTTNHVGICTRICGRKKGYVCGGWGGSRLEIFEGPIISSTCQKFISTRLTGIWGYLCERNKKGNLEFWIYVIKLLLNLWFWMKFLNLKFI